jgi:alpha-D-xyloside xylohydrolase
MRCGVTAKKSTISAPVTIFMRERLKPYIKGLMQAAHERGTPVMRTLFYEFPEDCKSWDVK